MKKKEQELLNITQNQDFNEHTMCNFNVNVNMKAKDIIRFITFLTGLEMQTNWGHSTVYGFSADGDGDFRCNFEINGISNTILEYAESIAKEKEDKSYNGQIQIY